MTRCAPNAARVCLYEFTVLAECSRPSSSCSDRSDFGIVATFDDEAGWRAYMDDAEHDRIRKELLIPIARERVTAQFEL